MRIFVYAAVVLLSLILAFPGCTGNVEKSEKPQDPVARGAYLVNAGGCHDCHSPKIFTPQGPIPDTTRLLSGHPPDDKFGEYPADIMAPDKWGGAFSNQLTAWAGPWGISFAANLTPAEISGLWSWTDTLFIGAMRTGKHMGVGQPILPPMPWPSIGLYSDEDLKAMFAYLKSIKPIDNVVPQPVPPPGQK